MEIRVINAAAVRQLLPMAECIPLMRRAFEVVTTGEAIQPIRQALQLPDGRGLLGWMPGYLASPERLGIKVVAVFAPGAAGQLGSHQGMVLLFDAQNGRPVAIVEAGEITGIRTAAATAVATDALAPRTTESLGVLGSGEQAGQHIAALLQVRPFKVVRIWSRTASNARALAAECAAHTPVPIVAVDSAREAASCDVVCTTTAAREPILFGAWLRPGQHLNLVGSSIPSTSEVDEATIQRGRVFVDFRVSALALAGDIRRAKSAGLIEDSHIVGNIGDVLTGRTSGRLSAADVTIFKSLGMASEDLVACDYVLAQAIRQGVGQTVEW